MKHFFKKLMAPLLGGMAGSVLSLSAGNGIGDSLLTVNTEKTFPTSQHTVDQGSALSKGLSGSEKSVQKPIWSLDPQDDGQLYSRQNTTLYGIPVYAEERLPGEYKLDMLTDDDFNALSETKRYQVANKLYSTLFYGVNTNKLKRAVASKTFISDTLERFEKENSIEELARVEELLKNYFDDQRSYGMLSHMMARLFHLSPGRHYFNRWAAYILTQSILFSPAYELETVYKIDAIHVYNRLVRSFDAGESLQWVTFSHMISDQNWRRFRSPEDNGREMLEIFLMDTNDSHVPMAAQTLKNWHLDLYTYTLVIGLDENTVPQTDLFPNRRVVNGYDFYSKLVKLPTFFLTVSRRLVDIFFPDFPETKKNVIAKRLRASHPRTWTGLLKQIVFSRSYLLYSHKTKSAEEAFLPLAKALDWHPTFYSFSRVTRDLDNMHQATMRYKLGRKTEIPLDTNSFAWFHKVIRDRLMCNIQDNQDDVDPEEADDGWPLKDLFRNIPKRLISKGEFDKNGKRTLLWYKNEKKRANYIIDSLFLRTLGRTAYTDEKRILRDLIDNLRHDSEKYDNPAWIDLYGNENPEDDLKERGYFALLVLDYISRLSELYRYESAESR